MHLQTLSSGSKGNCTLLRAGELALLVDAGLSGRALGDRLDAARLPAPAIGHVLLTHGHLDHTRGASAIARRAGATIHCSPSLQRNGALRRAQRLESLRVGAAFALGDASPVEIDVVAIPHDANPTVAFRFEHQGRRAVILTDMGRPDAEVARRLAGAHLLVLEFNHDAAMLRDGPYPAPLKRRIAGDGGHLSNDQAREMLRRLAGPELHTLVLAHLSETNNAPERALDAARATLAGLGLDGVDVLVAAQAEVGPNLRI